MFYNYILYYNPKKEECATPPFCPRTDCPTNKLPYGQTATLAETASRLKDFTQNLIYKFCVNVIRIMITILVEQASLTNQILL